MANLALIKPTVYILKVGKQQLELKYTLESFSYLEEEFGSVDNAIDLFNSKNYFAVIKFLEAGLLGNREKYDVQKILKKADLKELLTVMAKAMRSSLTSDFGFDKEFDWAMLYFIAKPALNFSNEEFWSSTPKTILTMLRLLKEVKGLEESEKITTQKDAVKAFMSW